MYTDEGLVAEYDESGNELRNYGYRPDSIWTTNPLWLREGGEYYWYQNDHLGTPQTLIDNAGNIVWEAQYTAFGKAQIQMEMVMNNLRLPGQYFDAETGFHDNWNRYYDPISGRYTQADPIGFSGGDVNLYAYVWNNPGNWIDPWGLYVINNSPNIVYFKPAGENDYPQTIFDPSGVGAEAIAPYSCSLEAYQDGVTVPCNKKHKDEVLKTVSGVNVIINPDCSVDLDHGWNPVLWGGQKWRGGWKDRKWQSKERAADWEDIFNAAEGS